MIFEQYNLKNISTVVFKVYINFVLMILDALLICLQVFIYFNKRMNKSNS